MLSLPKHEWLANTTRMDPATLRFRARIAITGINPYVRISAAQAGRLKSGWRKPMPVRVQINGKPEPAWRINLMPAGDGGFLLYLHAKVREASGTAVGDVVRVSLVFDATYKPLPPMPSWFRAALRRDAAARAGWRKLAPSRQKEILRYLAGLKSAQARERNLAKALYVLAGNKARYMARNWNA